VTLTVGAADEVAGLVFAGSGLPVAAPSEADVRFEWDVSAIADTGVLWVARAAEGRSGARVIAPCGDGLWRRAPWPAADTLFDLDPPTREQALVIGDGPAAAELAGMLETHGVAVARAARLSAGELEAASVVVLAGEPDEALPGEAPAVLAAGRVLATSPRSALFGFRPGIDHCCGETPAALANLVESVLRYWDAFGSMRAHGRIAAARHRSSRVLRDLETDLELGL
jgi:hypothetical protein